MLNKVLLVVALGFMMPLYASGQVEYDTLRTSDA